jgi:hypothetical protein
MLVLEIVDRGILGNDRPGGSPIDASGDENGVD